MRELYDRGADPLAVMQDLLETAHFLTRVKVAPGAEGFFDGGSAKAQRARTMAGKLAVPALTRAWQMLLYAVAPRPPGRSGARHVRPCPGEQTAKKSL